MPYTALPAASAWRHRDARDGFEVMYASESAERVGGPRVEGHRLDGCTTAVEAGAAWVVEYAIEVDALWRTRRAMVACRTSDGVRQVHIEADGRGHWTVDGEPVPALDGCLDIDLESSAVTNLLPLRRLDPEVGQAVPAPAAYVRVPGLGVERLEQQYARLPDENDRRRFDYRAPAFDTACRLVVDSAGLAIDYPGLAMRVA